MTGWRPRCGRLPRRGAFEGVWRMSFIEAIKSVYSQYATFSGRARRSEYWYFYLFSFLISMFVYLPGLMLGMPSEEGGSGSPVGMLLLVAYAVFVLASFLPSLAVLVRRLHDTGRSGWWFWIGLVPFIGGIWLFVLMLLPSTEGDNEYGTQP